MAADLNKRVGRLGLLIFKYPCPRISSARPLITKASALMILETASEEIYSRVSLLKVLSSSNTTKKRHFSSSLIFSNVFTMIFASSRAILKPDLKSI